jgi:hypothetical protein
VRLGTAWLSVARPGTVLQVKVIARRWARRRVILKMIIAARQGWALYVQARHDAVWQGKFSQHHFHRWCWAFVRERQD